MLCLEINNFELTNLTGVITVATKQHCNKLSTMHPCTFISYRKGSSSTLNTNKQQNSPLVDGSGDKTKNTKSAKAS